MYFPVELVFKSYMPKSLEPGMLFINKLHQDTVKETVEIWALDKVPQEPMDSFLAKHGAPVELYLVYNDEMLAEPEQIGWMDDGEWTEDLRDITLKDINTILNDFDGEVLLEIDDDDFTYEEEVSPILYADKVTLALPSTYDDDDEEEEYDEEMEEEEE